MILYKSRCYSCTESCSSLAQLVEHSAVNRVVAGSSPARGAIWRDTQEAEEDGLLNR